MSGKKAKDKRRKGGAKPKKRLSSSHRQPREIGAEVKIGALTERVRALEWENQRLRESAQKLLGQAERQYAKKARAAAAWKRLAARKRDALRAAHVCPVPEIHEDSLRRQIDRFDEEAEAGRATAAMLDDAVTNARQLLWEVDHLRRLLRRDHAADCAGLRAPNPCDCTWRQRGD